MSAQPVEREQRVSPLELFFDLVFVFAFTQVTTVLSSNPTWSGLGHALLLVTALWWAWAAYAWLTNTVDPEEGFVGAALLVVLIAMFLAALAVPGVFGDDGVLFGAAFLVVVAMHLALYCLAGRGNRDLLSAVLRLAPWTLLGATLILVAGFGFADGARTWLWVAALACTYVGAGLSGSTGWRVFPSHLAERYGLVIIIALGEAFVAIGIGATGMGIGLGEVVAAILGLLVAASLWLAYFDFFSIRGARMLADLRGPDRVALARDLYAYAHLPLIAAIVLFAFAMKTTVGHVGNERRKLAFEHFAGGPVDRQPVAFLQHGAACSSHLASIDVHFDVHDADDRRDPELSRDECRMARAAAAAGHHALRGEHAVNVVGPRFGTHENHRLLQLMRPVLGGIGVEHDLPYRRAG